ncbi:nuclear transport factor 2 family protein [Methylobacter psychrophilus]|uniref:nuclear transport factor 2 family protein n=1 Tax=Methylobacter psychrophilus TaxID=96941 RepID=UPI0021D50440|nr:nuclear transport factor 2 family protein [Methylobacter psychrophilus]
MKPVLSLLLMALMLNACSHVEPNSVRDYLALAPAESDVKQNQRIQPLIKLFNKIETVSLADQIAKTYAEKLYFNDTIVTLHTRQDLLKYMQHTQKSLDSMSFEVLGTQEKGNDMFVRWTMNTRFTVMGQSQNIQSVGMSHLRFNSDGKIILHQDYWDSMQGFYQHLPIIGGILQWIKNGLQDY